MSDFARIVSQFMQKQHEAEMKDYLEEASEEETVDVRPVSHTLEEISRGTGLSHDQIRSSMKAEEDETFMHLPQPEEPTRYALAAHAAGVAGWQPGLDF